MGRSILEVKYLSEVAELLQDYKSFKNKATNYKIGDVVELIDDNLCVIDDIYRVRGQKFIDYYNGSTLRSVSINCVNRLISRTD